MIFNISNAPARVLPVLNSSYPQDVSLMESASGSATTFQVQIATAGKPAKYTYQWYVNGSAVSGANGTSFTKTGLTSAASYTVYCTVTNKAGTVTSRVATLTVTSSKPVYTYTGNATFTQEDAYNWKIKFLTSGNLKFSYLGNAASGIDVFCVGGGGGAIGEGESFSLAGGGGGYTNTSLVTGVNPNTDYAIFVGNGGSRQVQGGTSSAFGVLAAGGYAPTGATMRIGANGGSGGGAGEANGGSDGGNGYSHGNNSGGTGQGFTTREFGEANGTLYAGGGGGGGGDGQKSGYDGGAGGGGKGGNQFTIIDSNGGTNTGGGGGGGTVEHTSGAGIGGFGGSGIVVIRNHR